MKINKWKRNKINLILKILKNILFEYLFNTKQILISKLRRFIFSFNFF